MSMLSNVLLCCNTSIWSYESCLAASVWVVHVSAEKGFAWSCFSSLRRECTMRHIIKGFLCSRTAQSWIQNLGLLSWQPTCSKR